MPVFKKYSVPATIFLCAAIINTKRNYWFKFNHAAISLRQLKQELNKNRLRILAGFGFEPQMEFETVQALTKQQIGEMKSHLNLQGHTMFHPCLPKFTDIEARTEILNQKKSWKGILIWLLMRLHTPTAIILIEKLYFQEKPAINVVLL